MSVQILDRREEIVNLVYQMKEFSVDEIISKFKKENERVNDIPTLKDYLFTLCELGTLQYNGDTYRVIPSEERLSYRRYAFRITE
ncbi:MAG: hypothetical protein ABFC57_04820 [Veillonellales bacterium]